MKKKIIWVIAAGAVILGIFWIMKPQEDTGSKQEAGSEEKAQIDQKILSFTIDGRSSQGVNQWHLEGNSAEIIGEDVHLNELKAIAYGEDTIVNLSSDRGIYRKEKGEVELIGNVVVTSDKGFSLKTEKASWSQITKEISTEELVHIEGEGLRATGTGGMANSDKRTAMLEKDVTVKMEPQTEVECDGRLEVDYEGNTAVFHDNVEVRDKDGNLFADKLTVDFDPDTKKLAQVVAEGNVRVKKGKSYTISEKAIYTDSTKSAKLIGRPRVVIDPEELSDFEKMDRGG